VSAVRTSAIGKGLVELDCALRSKRFATISFGRSLRTWWEKHRGSESPTPGDDPTIEMAQGRGGFGRATTGPGDRSRRRRSLLEENVRGGGESRGL